MSDSSNRWGLARKGAIHSDLTRGERNDPARLAAFDDRGEREAAVEVVPLESQPSLPVRRDWELERSAEGRESGHDLRNEARHWADQATTYLEIRDPSVLHDLLSAVRRTKAPFAVELSDGVQLSATPCRGTASEGPASERSVGELTERGLELAFDVTPPLTPLMTGERARAHISIFGASFVVEATLSIGDPLARLVGPYRLFSRADRAHERHPTRNGTLSWRDSSGKGTGAAVTAEVLDVSADGTRVRLSPGSSFPPNAGGEAVLEVGDRRFSVEPEVRRVSTVDDNVELGLKLRFPQHADAVGLARLVDEYAFPNLRPRSAAPAGEVMRVMRDSGYLALRDDGVEHAQPIDAGDVDLSIDSVAVTRDGAVVGHMSCTRVYSQTWLYHQLATIGRGRSALEGGRALYLSMTAWVLALGGKAGYSMGYFDREKRWHRSFLDGFVRSAGSPDLAIIEPLDRFELDAKLLAASAREPSWSAGEDDSGSIRTATSSDLEAIDASLADTHPPIFRNARDLTLARLGDPTLVDVIEDASLARRRRILVAISNGQVVGFALCETGSSKLSIFDIFNAAHLHATPAMTETLLGRLLEAVKSHYAEAGVSTPLLMAAPGALSHPSLNLVETMGCIVLSSEGLRHCRNYLQLQFGRYVATRSA